MLDKVVQQGGIIEVIPLMSMVWKLTFSVHPLKLTSGTFTSVLRLTINEDNVGTSGSRIFMSGFLKGSTTLRTFVEVGTERSYHFADTEIPLDKTSKIEVKQELLDNKYMLTITINDQESGTVTQTLPQKFENVTVYAGDNHFPPANAILKDYEFINLSE